jgi:TIR domain
MKSDNRPAKAAGRDFFVSYAHEDHEWAEWVAWQLEQAGYTVLFQKWDMVAGTNWVKLMRQGISASKRTVVVLSEHYLSSLYGEAEWSSAWADDPLSEQRKLLILRITECERPDVLRWIVSVDLFGRTEKSARELLVESVKNIVAGRAKPAAAPAYPVARVVPTEPTFPAAPSFRRVCACVDVHSALPIASHVQLTLHEQARVAVRDACMRAGVVWERVTTVTRDDGLLIALAPGIDESTIIPALMHNIRTCVQSLNHQTEQEGRLRLRVGIAQGTVQQGAERMVGRGVDRAVALSGGDELRRALNSAPACDVAYAVADDIFQEIIGDGHSQVSADGFYRVHMRSKLGVRSVDGWISIPVTGRGGNQASTGRPESTSWRPVKAFLLGAGAGAASEVSTLPDDSDYDQDGMPEDDPEAAEFSSGLEVPDFLQDFHDGDLQHSEQYADDHPIDLDHDHDYGLDHLW